ncbi:MAG TPA: GntR family transcriptional regulator [Tepidisphaeraceae bacterium]|jgi:DNA-binding LacI/PurR family transcriptional regulator|nr:GntR family transcriptional regulator [Tepidisphaeraceae bacterium]
MPGYLQVAMRLRQQMKRGDFGESGKLPTVRQLSTDLNISHGVAQRALQHLQGQRLVQAKRAVGARVIANDECASTAFLFGVVQPYASSFSFTIFNRLETAIESRQNLFVMRSSRNEPGREKQIIQHLIDNGVNGILLWPVEADDNQEYLRQAAERVPIVLVDRVLRDLPGPSVVLDYAQLGAEIVDQFRAVGCRNILCLSDPIDISSYNELHRSIQRRAEELGPEVKVRFLDMPMLQLLHRYYDGDDRAIELALGPLKNVLREEPVDGIFCPQDDVVYRFLIEPGNLRLLADARLGTITMQRDRRRLKQFEALGILAWVGDVGRMIGEGIDILQDMTMSRRPLRRQVRVPFERA